MLMSIFLDKFSKKENSRWPKRLHYQLLNTQVWVALAFPSRPAIWHQAPHSNLELSFLTRALSHALKVWASSHVLPLPIKLQKFSLLFCYLLHLPSHNMPNHELSDDGVVPACRATTSGCLPECLLLIWALQGNSVHGDLAPGVNGVSLWFALSPKPGCNKE